jgi:photosystem II stability/assembly factor-like uncharacterized protein
MSNLDIPFREFQSVESPFGPEQDSRPGLLAADSTPTLSIAVSPFSSTIVLAGTAGRGVVRFNGTLWSATTLGTGTVNTLLYDREDSSRVWMGGDGAAGTLQVSTNQGRTWSPSAVGLEGRVVYTLSQDPHNPALLAVGTDNGVYLSTDQGAHWVAAGLSGQAVRAVIYHPQQSNKILAATDARIYASTNPGVTWEPVGIEMDGFGYLGVTHRSSEPYRFYFYSRYGGIVMVGE